MTSSSVARRADDEERRHLALADAGRELDIDLAAVVEGAQRPPRRRVALDRVAEIEREMSTPVATGAAACAARILAAQRDELVLRILPGDRGHIGLLGRAQLEVIGAPVGVDDEIGRQVRPRRLDEDVDLLGRARAALGVADDPAHRVAGGDRAGADQLLAGLQGDVGDLARRGIDLIERAVREGIDLHGVDVAVAHRLHARGGVGLR